MPAQLTVKLLPTFPLFNQQNMGVKWFCALRILLHVKNFLPHWSHPYTIAKVGLSFVCESIMMCEATHICKCPDCQTSMFQIYMKRNLQSCKNMNWKTTWHLLNSSSNSGPIAFYKVIYLKFDLVGHYSVFWWNHWHWT